MEISFPNLIMPKVTAMGTVSFQVKVDGEFIWCEISAEALSNHFDAISMNEKDLLHAFHNARTTIEETTRRHLESNGGRSVLLMTGNF
jgi:hypothetical protein